MSIKILQLKTNNKKINQKFKNVYVFTLKYSKKIKKNEFHLPIAAKIIIETYDSKFIYWLFQQLFIISDENGNITILTNANYEQIIQEKVYFDKVELNKALYLESIYKNKEELGLFPNEIIKKAWATNIISLNKVLKIKLPYEFGGDF